MILYLLLLMLSGNDRERCGLLCFASIIFYAPHRTLKYNL